LADSIPGKLWSVELQFVSSAAKFVVKFKTVSSGAHLSAPLQFFSPSASNWLGGMQSALLHSVTSFAALPCTMSVQLQSVSSAVFHQLSCNPSALAYVMQFICCNRPAVKHHLSYKLQAPLQSVILVALCLLSHDLSAWQQSVSSVCQLSCNTAAQLRCVSSAAVCQLSCKLSARLQSVNCGRTLSARLHTASQQSVSPAATCRTPAICQPSFDVSAQLQSNSCT